MVHRALRFAPWFFAVACRDDCRNDQQRADAAEVPASAAPAPSTSVSARATQDAATALSDEEKEAFATYNAALARGRTATLAKDYATAITAFAAALAAIPDDARALGEKGFAEHLARDDDAALADLQKAAALTTNTKLSAQIWFNLGLVEETKRPSDALVDFAHSESLSPSAAARAKINGRSVCPIKADRKRVAALPARSWVDVVRVLTASDGGVATSSPMNGNVSTDAEAKQALGVDKPLAVGQDNFYVVQTGEIMLWTARHVVQVSAGAYYVYANVGQGMGGRCPFVDAVTLEAFGGFVRVSRKDAPMMMTYMCSSSAPEIHDCDSRPGEVPAGTACPTAPTTFHESFIDPALHAIVIALEDSASCALAGNFCDTRRIALRPDGGGVHATGLGCNNTFAP